MHSKGVPLSSCTTHADLPSLMTAFSEMLSRDLAHTDTQTTYTIHADIQHLGCRIDAVKQKADLTIARTNQNTAIIQDIDDLENR